MLTKAEIKNRIAALPKDETELFSTSELGKSYPSGIFVHRLPYQNDYPVYEVSQMGDYYGTMNIFEAVEIVAKEAKI